MKNLTVLKLGNIDKKSLKKKEMDLLIGGNYCSYGYANQVANFYAGKCSCFCGSGYGNNSSNISEDASLTKSNGTIL